MMLLYILFSYIFTLGMMIEDLFEGHTLWAFLLAPIFFPLLLGMGFRQIWKKTPK